jgi:hypothetical protein
MFPHDIDPLKIYMLVSPLLIFGLALAVVWLTSWMDRHERRQRPVE